VSIHKLRPDGVDSINPPGGSEPPMDIAERVAKLESDLAAVKIDVAVIKANGASKSDIAEVRSAISEAKSSIVMWVVGAIFLAQLLPTIPAILKLFVKP